MEKLNLIAMLVGALLAVIYRRVIKKQIRINSCQRTISELLEFCETNYETIIKQFVMSSEELCKYFGKPNSTKQYQLAFNSVQITFSSLVEMRFQISHLCNILREQIVVLERLYGDGCIPEEYELMLNEIARKVRGVMWVGDESWEE